MVLHHISHFLSNLLRGGVILLTLMMAGLLLVYVVAPVALVLRGMVSSSSKIPEIAEKRAEEKARIRRNSKY